MSRPQGVSAAAECCSRQILPPVFNLHDGDDWTCPECKRRWVWIEDEAEGGYFFHSPIGCICLNQGDDLDQRGCPVHDTDDDEFDNHGRRR